MIIRPKRIKKKNNNSKNFRNIQVASINDFDQPEVNKSIRRKYKPNPDVIKDSFGESVISEWLRKHAIKFIRERSFKDLKNPNTDCYLRFDFWLPDLKMCIEYDGKQHFQYVKKFDKGDKNALRNRQYKDGIKNRFCEYRKIKLLRISYLQIKEIEKILCWNVLTAKPERIN